MSKDNANIEKLAKEALQDESVLSELLIGVSPDNKKEKIRNASFKALLLISEEHPEVLYPKWDFFTGLLKEDNASFKYIAIYLLANLTKIDADKKFDKIFNKYFDLLNDVSVIPPSHLAKNSGIIANSKPHLQSKITKKLLSIDDTHHNPGRKDLIKGYIIEGFDQYFETAKDKEVIVDFIKKQLKSKSPTTVKKAKEFLKKWGIWKTLGRNF
jgi:hypothetical protein